MIQFFKKCLGILLLSTLLFSCGEDGSKKTIQLFLTKTVWAAPWESVKEAFEADYPEIRLETEIVGGGVDWRPVLQTKASTNTLPDIFMIDGSAEYQRWAEFLEDLSDQPWVENFLPIARESAYLEGQLMGMPLGLEGYGLIYNRDLLQRVGAEDINSFSSLERAVEQLKRENITPFGSGFGTVWVLGNHLFNIPFSVMEEPKAFIEGVADGKTSFTEATEFGDLKSLIDLIKSNSEENTLVADHHLQVSLFAGESVAFIQQGNWKEQSIYEANENISMGLLPLFINDSINSAKIPVGVPWYFVVKRESKVKEEAKLFLNWLMNSEKGKELVVSQLNTIPAYSGFKTLPEGAVSRDILSYSERGETIPWVFGDFPGGYSKSVSSLLQEYIAGKIGYEEFLLKAETEWKKLSR